MSEEQICELFASAGQVVNFRLVYDKETGRPKGFGFLEYTNVDEAASAVRNLNEHEIMGRTLRVDYSNDNGGGAGNRNDHNKQNQGMPQPPQFDMGMPPGAQPNGTDALPPLPQGTALPDGLSAPDAISRTLSTLPAPQLLDIISQMKGLCSSDPAKATNLLQQAPQLGYAIFQALLSLGLVDGTVLTSLLQQVPPQQAPPQQQPPPQQPPPMPYQPPGMPPQYGQQPQFPPPQHPPFPAQQQYAPTPPVQHQAYQPPPQQPPPPQQAQPPADPGQQALIAQVMAMTREQIFALDPAARDQIMALRASWGNPVS